MMMPEDGVWWLNFNQYEDLRVYEVGIQRCGAGYQYGPIVRDRYILHYVFQGEGTLYMDDKEFEVKENQFFLLPADVLVHYKASETNPWHYAWVHFHGFKATQLLQEMGLSRKNPVYKAKEENDILLQSMIEVISNYEKEYMCIGNMYFLFHHMIELVEKKTKKEVKAEPALAYVRSAINYINIKYCEPIFVHHIANHCGVDRAYLSKIFKHATGYTLQEYLIQFRIKRAKQLLEETDVSIQHVSFSVGYNDAFTFSKVFKRQTGYSPSDWRKQKKNTLNKNKDN